MRVCSIAGCSLDVSLWGLGSRSKYMLMVPSSWIRDVNVGSCLRFAMSGVRLHEVVQYMCVYLAKLIPRSSISVAGHVLLPQSSGSAVVSFSWQSHPPKEQKGCLLSHGHWSGSHFGWLQGFFEVGKATWLLRLE